MKKLHLGCGHRYLDGWINLDISEKDIYGKKLKVDVTHNLNKFPYPFKDKSFDFVLMEHTLEHLNNPNRVIKELLRITKKNGIIKIVVPHFSHYGSFRDPTHKHYFSLDSIDYFKGFKVLSKKLSFSHNKILRILFNPLINFNYRIYERFFCYLFPAEECIWELKPLN